MKKIIFLSAVIIASCNTQPTTAKDNTQVPPSDTIKSTTTAGNKKFDFLTGCYQNVLNGDTAFLKIKVHEFIVDGTLNYKRAQKDSNEGTFTGVIRGEMIVIHYNFYSEGKTSMREIAFKIKGDQLVEGFGDILMKGDSAVFENVASLNFQDAQTFNKIACP
ncbi:MAG: hypothetical protein ACMG51_06095 [Ginsengibacter sp.]